MATPTMHDRNIDQAAYWNGPAGRRWMERQDTQDILLAPISELSLDRAHPAKGEHVVDIGCGCGATSIELGRRVGPTGYVLGLDISAPMLGRARARAPAELPLEFVLADATVHAFEPGRSDLLFSRFGVMFFADPVVSFANMRKALRTGGRLGFACWREPRQNPWMMIALQEAYKHVPRLPEMGPDDPGPFAFASDQRVRRILAEAGFSSIAMEACDVSLDVAFGTGLEAAVSSALEVGPVSRALEGQPQEVMATVANAIRRVFAPLAKSDSIPLGASVWIVTAENS
jgi:ubiquinone/menaquinone biosynthesis C-methylase UbiE